MIIFRLIRQIILIALVFLIGYFFGIREMRFYKVISGSMEPTIAIGDVLMSEKPGNLKRGTIVALRDPKGSKEILIKRLIGLPGDTIEVAKRQTLVNALARPFQARGGDGLFPETSALHGGRGRPRPGIAGFMSQP